MTTDNSSQDTAPTSAPEASASTSTSSSQASTSTPQASTSASGGSVAQAVQAGADNAGPATPVYNPNYKFKVYDKEYEIDPLFRPLIKDADTEEKIRQMHSKAYALETMKEKLEKTREESQQYRQSVSKDLKTYEFFNTLVGNKDWDTFFGRLGVPDEEIFKFVEKKIQMLQATPEQRAEYDRQIELKQQAYYQNQHIQELNQAYQTQAVQTRTMQLESLLARPDVQKYAAAWDEKSGSIGAFRQLVVDEAAAAFYTQGRDLSAEEAINLVVQKFGRVITPAQQAAMTQASAPMQTTPQGTPIIPNVAGRGTSPVKKAPKSLDDLRKMANEMA